MTVTAGPTEWSCCTATNSWARAWAGLLEAEPEPGRDDRVPGHDRGALDEALACNPDVVVFEEAG